MIERDSDWAKELFIKHPKLFYPILESMKKDAEIDTNGLVRIFEQFGICKGSKILDLYCGIGRHSIPLARKGYEVVGYDPSKYYLRKASEWARREFRNTERINFYHGNPGHAHEILHKYEGLFRAIIIMFTSVGYSRTSDDILTLKNLLPLASDNCILILETENRDWRIKNFQPIIEYKFKKLIIHESWKLNLENSIFEGHSRYYEVLNRGTKPQLVLNLDVEMRLYSLHEILDILQQAGWQFVRSYSGFDDESGASVDSKNIVTISVNHD